MKILKILQYKKPFSIALFFSVIYFFFYLYTVGFLVMGDTETKLLDNWGDLLFKQRVPFVWEPIGTFSLKIFSLFFAPLNLILALLLSFLIFLNVAIVVYSYYLPKVCRVGHAGLFGLLPSFLTGFACCVPTVLIAIGPVLPSLTVFFIQLRPFLLPSSLILLMFNIPWSLSRISNEHLKQTQNTF
ncbi:MAG: hypothetical protein GOU98_02515 [Candidatus Altiarchaeota archaeon]|nr:hypothetical protein [Candidatus Altiarchaeota archaeon]